MPAAHNPRPRFPSMGRLAAERPNRSWARDITYERTPDAGPVPLLAILDAGTPEIVGYELLH